MINKNNNKHVTFPLSLSLALSTKSIVLVATIAIYPSLPLSSLCERISNVFIMIAAIAVAAAAAPTTIPSQQTTTTDYRKNKIFPIFLSLSFVGKSTFHCTEEQLALRAIFTLLLLSTCTTGIIYESLGLEGPKSIYNFLSVSLSL